MALAGHDASSNPKQAAIAAIARAQIDLERAVTEIDMLPAIDVHAVALAAHALNNFLTVSGGVVALLLPPPRPPPDHPAPRWVPGPPPPHPPHTHPPPPPLYQTPRG